MMFQQLQQQRPALTGRAGRRALRVQAAGSTYGNNFRVTTFGESHGKGVGCVIDGVPPRLPITNEEIQFELDRRRPGQSIITTPRKEEDTCEILSGVFAGESLGTPIAVLVRNKDQRSDDYSEMSVAYRPSHADATYDFKYGIRAVAGGGRSSARETIGRVAAGAVAKKLLKVVGGTEVRGFDPTTHGGHASMAHTQPAQQNQQQHEQQDYWQGCCMQCCCAARDQDLAGWRMLCFHVAGN
eukprot:GHRQ01031973.1.p1 GENE.GHRQ01031973.1~~GHRQ01031973.1.p1  ORF type:complete len:241 (-),score=52.37 GHRQ01031973.1:63-785(-)